MRCQLRTTTWDVQAASTRPVPPGTVAVTQKDACLLVVAVALAGLHDHEHRGALAARLPRPHRQRLRYALRGKILRQLGLLLHRSDTKTLSSQCGWAFGKPTCHCCSPKAGLI